MKRFSITLQTLWLLLRALPALSVAILLVQTCRLYNFGYFGADAFNNLCLVQAQNFGQMIAYIADPVSAYFRPVGMMYYWVFLRLFDLSAGTFRWGMWSLHAANTTLVYFLLKRCSAWRPGTAVGAMLFASQAVFSEIYWNFGAIFELITALFCFIATLLWTSERRGWLQVLLASVALLLALKSKEMAASMPFIWLSYDLLLRKHVKPSMLAHCVLPAGLVVWYSLSHASAMAGTAPNHPYYMSITASTLATGFATYFNMVLRTQFPWQVWWAGVMILLLILVLLRGRTALFFLVYIFITFLPVIFLVNHRVALFWYLPFLGVCGLAAILADSGAGLIRARNPQWLAQAGLYSVFVLLCWGTFLLHKESNRSERSWAEGVADEYRAFVSGLRALPSPPYRETIFFDSLPPHVEQAVLLSVSQVALRRTDLQAKLVSRFPPEARYRLRFEDSRLLQLSP